MNKMKRIKLKTDNFAKGRKVFVEDGKWRYGFEDEGVGFDAPEEGLYHFTGRDAAYVIKTMPFDEWGLSSGGMKYPFRRNYLDIDFQPKAEITEFMNRESWWLNLPFSDAFPYMAQRDGNFFMFHSRVDEGG